LLMSQKPFKLPTDSYKDKQPNKEFYLK